MQIVTQVKGGKTLYTLAEGPEWQCSGLEPDRPWSGSQTAVGTGGTAQKGQRLRLRPRRRGGGRPGLKNSCLRRESVGGQGVRALGLTGSPGLINGGQIRAARPMIISERQMTRDRMLGMSRVTHTTHQKTNGVGKAPKVGLRTRAR